MKTRPPLQAHVVKDCYVQKIARPPQRRAINGPGSFNVGCGFLRKPGREEIFETYYSYAVTQATKLTLDYQFVNNPAYNTQRGPVNAFAVRLHTQF